MGVAASCEWKNALFVWTNGSMLLQHVSVSTLPEVDQPQTVFIILIMQASKQVTVFIYDWCLCRTHEVSFRDDTVVDLSVLTRSSFSVC